jgi:hypothetical protein
VVARKPLVGTVAATVLATGCGALNIDACRIGTDDDLNGGAYSDGREPRAMQPGGRGLVNAQPGEFTQPAGRWPANVVLDPEAAAMLDAQTGELGISQGGSRGAGGQHGRLSPIAAQPDIEPGYGDSGGASRFFYCAKASSRERNAGLDGFEPAVTHDGRDVSIDNPYLRGETTRRNVHPTVKPIDLMRWLVRLVTPPAGLVLDPFTGSGTTGIAASLEGFRFVGVEREPEYAAIARARLAWWAKRGQVSTEAALRAGLGEDVIAASGQSAFDLLGGAA